MSKTVKTMTIARALKEKNRIAGRLNTVRTRIANYNSCEITNNKRPFDIEELFQENKKLEENLVAIKAGISRANAGIVDKINKLGEIKAEITWLNNVSTREGKYTENGYGGKIEREFTAVISANKIVQETEALQKECEDLQDEIDAYNASHSVDIELFD
jgi:hypothetical protein